MMRSLIMYRMTGLIQSMIREKMLPADIAFPITFETRETGLVVRYADQMLVFSIGTKDSKFGYYKVAQLPPKEIQIGDYATVAEFTKAVLDNPDAIITCT